ncbi:MAG TPA: FkbM family methyltransferase [Gaiellaceae bacterium]
MTGDRLLGGLGALARGARAAGLGRPFDAVRDACDAPFVRFGRPPLRAEIEGLPFRGYLRHRSFLANGARRETSYIELFARTLRPGLTVVDGGAHLGVYTVLAARAVGSTGRVVAFEPDAYNFGALKLNVRRLAGDNVRLSRRALAAAPGRAELHVSRSTIGSSFVRRGDTTSVASVETTSVDDELAELDLDGGLLVKLNVEGAEGLAVEGMRRTLERVEDATLFAEVHPALMRAVGAEPDDLVAELLSLGFDVSWIAHSAPTAVPLDERTAEDRGHLFAVRVSDARSDAPAGGHRARPRRQPHVGRADPASRAS